MAHTITISDGTAFTFNEGDVKNVRPRISTDLEFDSMPQEVASKAMLFDLSGVKKVITVTGELQDTNTNRLSTGTATTINQQRQWLEKNLNGTQSGALFDSPYCSTWNGIAWVISPVLFSVIEWSNEEGNPEGLPFQMVLFVGDV